MKRLGQRIDHKLTFAISSKLSIKFSFYILSLKLHSTGGGQQTLFVGEELTPSYPNKAVHGSRVTCVFRLWTCPVCCSVCQRTTAVDDQCRPSYTIEPHHIVIHFLHSKVQTTRPHGSQTAAFNLRSINAVITSVLRWKAVT